MRLEIDNWRCSGVPFYLRTGKHLPVTQTELRLVFKHPPRLCFRLMEQRPDANQLVVKLDPTTGVKVILDAQHAHHQRIEPIDLTMEFAKEGGEGPTPYEVLLHAAMVGDSTRVPRQDGVEQTGGIFQPWLHAPPRVEPYTQGAWGP